MATIRELYEQEEMERLSPRAALSVNSRGRKMPEEPCSIRTCFQVDSDKGLNCKAFRRLARKTQVFVQPKGDHYRNRLQHSLEVAQVSVAVARALRLNVDLTQCIGTLHDVGHGSGHALESSLRRLLGGHYEHNQQSYRVLDVLENNGRGLNLTYEVLDGVLNHTGETPEPVTCEGSIVKRMDKVYVFHDLEDAVRACILTIDDVPADLRTAFGETLEHQIQVLVRDMIYASMEGDIGFSDKVYRSFKDLRAFMYDRVYLTGIAKAQSEKIEKIVEELFKYFVEHVDELPEYIKGRIDQDGIERCVADYISGFSDNYLFSIFNRIFIPERF